MKTGSVGDLVPLNAEMLYQFDSRTPEDAMA